MRIHIDWLTFTMPMNYDTFEGDVYARAVERAFHTTFDQETLASAFGGVWEKNEHSRAPYVDSWRLGDAGITLFASQNLSHCCIEISGQGCEKLLMAKTMGVVLAQSRERVSRIDIACDIETTTRPDEFVAELAHGRMRSHGYQTSDTGSTYYVGSKTSDRYARVYRYNPPHPRSNLLRIEHVFRKEYAKKVAGACMDSGTSAVAKSAGDAFGWAHPVWELDVDKSPDISTVKAERQMGKTVFWLVKSVAPAFKRMVNEGTIKDPDEFLTRYFLS